MHISACLLASSLREPAVFLSSGVETPLRIDMPIDRAVLLLLGAFFKTEKNTEDFLDTAFEYVHIFVCFLEGGRFSNYFDFF